MLWTIICLLVNKTVICNYTQNNIKYSAEREDLIIKLPKAQSIIIHRRINNAQQFPTRY